MNHDKAASMRDRLNDTRFVEGPDDDSGGFPFRLARVNQPGYLNGEPLYEVVLTIVHHDSFMLPSDFLADISDRGCYLRVDDDELHIRDWEADRGKVTADA